MASYRNEDCNYHEHLFLFCYEYVCVYNKQIYLFSFLF
jgi:hypothetical protein